MTQNDDNALFDENLETPESGDINPSLSSDVRHSTLTRSLFFKAEHNERRTKRHPSRYEDQEIPRR